MGSCRSPDTIAVSVDDEHLVADAGLILAATLAEGLLLRELFDEGVDLGDAPGAANVGEKAMTLVHSALAGGTWIGDADWLRAGATEEVLGHRVTASSTLGTFLRSFTWGSARQLDQVAGEALTRAWAAGEGPGPWPLTIDIDSTHCQTYGLAKQGAAAIGRDGTRGYHPLVASVAGTADVLHSRLREGLAHSGRGAANFLAEAVNRARRAGATGPITIRADSAFYNHKILAACQQQGVRCSITAKLTKLVRDAIGHIPDHAWTPIPYWLDDGADVAETGYHPFGRKGRTMRLIVRRVRPTPGSQLALFCDYDYHPFITDRDGAILELEADHRHHAEVENAIRDLKEGVGLGHLPSGKFAANAAWLTLNVIAHNLARWTSRIGLGEQLVTTKTLRMRYLTLPGRLTRSARRVRLHLPRRWPWAERFGDSAGPAALHAIPNLTTRAHPARSAQPRVGPRHPGANGHHQARGRAGPSRWPPPSVRNVQPAPPRPLAHPVSQTISQENGHGGSRLSKNDGRHGTEVWSDRGYEIDTSTRGLHPWRAGCFMGCALHGSRPSVGCAKSMGSGPPVTGRLFVTSRYLVEIRRSVGASSSGNDRLCRRTCRGV